MGKDGIRYTRKGKVQRYICRSCGFRFSESTLNGKVELDIAGKILKESNPGQNFPQPNVVPVDLPFEPSPENFPFEIGKNIGSHNHRE